MLNKMHFYYPKPSDQASRHVMYVSFAGRCIFQESFRKLKSKIKLFPNREEDDLPVDFGFFMDAFYSAVTDDKTVLIMGTGVAEPNPEVTKVAR